MDYVSLDWISPRAFWSDDEIREILACTGDYVISLQDEEAGSLDGTGGVGSRENTFRKG